MLKQFNVTISWIMTHRRDKVQIHVRAWNGCGWVAVDEDRMHLRKRAKANRSDLQQWQRPPSKSTNSSAVFVDASKSGILFSDFICWDKKMPLHHPGTFKKFPQSLGLWAIAFEPLPFNHIIFRCCISIVAFICRLSFVVFQPLLASCRLPVVAFEVSPFNHRFWAIASASKLLWFNP